MKVLDFLKAIEKMPIEINLSVYTIVTEISDEPCSAEVRAFASIESAMNALEKQLNEVIDCYELSVTQIMASKKSLAENYNKAFVVTLDEDDNVEYYAHIELLKVEN